MEAFRAILRQAGTTTGHPPSRIILNAARVMCAATVYVNDRGEPLPRDFSVAAAPEPPALAETPPPTTASPTAADGLVVLASSVTYSPRARRNSALHQAGKPLQPWLLLLTASSLVPASSSSSTALGLPTAYARHQPADPAKGSGIFGTSNVLRAHQKFELPWSSIMSKYASYSTSSGDAYAMQCLKSKPDGSEDPPVTYVIGMFEEINDPKWNPLEFAESHALLENVNLVGDQKDREYTILTEMAKYWFASLPLLIEKLKMCGYSFYHPVTIHQLMVDRHGQFVIRDGTLLQKTNRRNASKDYFSSASVFEIIIRHSYRGADLPYSFEDLLDKLRMKRQQPHGYYMTIHPTFLPLPAYSQAYLDVYDYVKECLTDDQATLILSSLKGSATRWEKIMKGNILLVAWYEDPYKKRHLEEEEERYILGMPKHLFRYLRHVHSHLLVYVKLLGEKYTKNEARVLIDCKFPRVMSDLYDELWHYKFLTDIETEGYFCIPGGACCPSPGFCLRRKLRLMIQESQRRKRLKMQNEQAQNQTGDRESTGPGSAQPSIK